VIAILALLFRMPGPLVVHVQDDKKEPIMGARVSCTSPDGMTHPRGHDGRVRRGEMARPGEGAVRCDITPPDRFHAAVLTGTSRRRAEARVWTTVVERPARIMVQVTRPQGQPRAKVAVRAVCGSETWEGRAGLLDGLATLYAPHGKALQVGLVRPSCPGTGRSRGQAAMLGSAVHRGDDRGRGSADDRRAQPHSRGVGGGQTPPEPDSRRWPSPDRRGLLPLEDVHHLAQELDRLFAEDAGRHCGP